MIMSESLEELKAIVDNAPSCGTAIEVCFYDYGEDMTLDYLNCENQFYDPEEGRWVDKLLVDNYFHSYINIKDIKRIIELMEWQQAAFEAHPNIDMDIEFTEVK